MKGTGSGVQCVKPHMQRPTNVNLAALGVIALVAAAGCGASGSSGGGTGSTASGQPTKATVTIHGTFRIQGGPYPGINRPLSGQITIHAGSETGRVVGTVDAVAGHFHATVAPGRYVLVGKDSGGSDLLCTADTTALAGHIAHAPVRCDVP
jgi:hypothetical protein